MKTKAVLSLSGGLDSSVLLAYLLREMNMEVIPVNFRYPSKHNAFESVAAVRVASYYELSCQTIDVTGVFEPFRSNLLTSGGDVPEGHYEVESMKQTVVPARNLIFASILAGFAESVGAEVIALGVHAGDHAIYPDCRPVFIDYLRCAVQAATDEKVSVIAPFLTIDKRSIIQHGIRLRVPFHLTRTCYKQQEIACGKCGSCQERLQSFRLNDVIDPIAYEAQ